MACCPLCLSRRSRRRSSACCLAVHCWDRTEPQRYIICVVFLFLTFFSSVASRLGCVVVCTTTCCTHAVSEQLRNRCWVYNPDVQHGRVLRVMGVSKCFLFALVVFFASLPSPTIKYSLLTCAHAAPLLAIEINPSLAKPLNARSCTRPGWLSVGERPAEDAIISTFNSRRLWMGMGCSF